MLQASRLSVKSGTTNKIIAGKSGGRKVTCSPRALNTYQELEQLARNKNYWAVLIVKAIDGLASGRLHQDNIYIEKKMSLAYGKGAFHIILPGVTASLEELPNGSFILQSIKADTNFIKHQENSQQPGLWTVHKELGREPELLPEGMINNKDYRPVVISDMASDSVHNIAMATREDLIKTNGTVKSMVSNGGFDLHHTPGEGGIVGLKKAKKALATAKDEQIVQSATLLANTMYKARNIDGVMWYSDWGGSAVLTRALQILHNEKEIKLDKHTIFMNRPTSVPKEAMELAKKIGIEPLNKGTKGGLSKDEIKGRFLHTEVTLKGTAKVAGATMGAAGAGFGLAGIGILSAPALTTVGIIGGLVGFTGGLMHVAKTASVSTKALKQKQYN